MLPFLERTTRRQRVFKRVILGATLVVLASMIGVSQSARYRLLLGAGQTRDVPQAEPDDETGSWGCTIRRLSPPGPQPAETSSSRAEPVRFYQMASGSETVLRLWWLGIPARVRLE